MLVSAVQNNDYGHVDLEVQNNLSELNEKELRHFRHEQLLGNRSNSEKKNLNYVLVPGQYYDSFLNGFKISSQNDITNLTFENLCNENCNEESSRSSELIQSRSKSAVELEWDSDEGNNSVEMDIDNEYVANNRPFPTRFSPDVRSNQDFSCQSSELENCIGSCLFTQNCIKISSNPGVPTTSRNISGDSKRRLSDGDDTNFDIFDFMKCSDDEVTDSTKAYCDKDELSLNEDLVNKYEKNLGHDIVKNKDICWAAGNFNSEVCPLKNYDICNDNSLLNFSRESLDGESRESFSRDWAFDESNDYVSQVQLPDPHIIVPKKTVDITKIKGWRKKQFTVEKCLANRNSILKKANVKCDQSINVTQQGIVSGVTQNITAGEDQNKDYAFVCDKLDDFLDQEAELKINYEIPHLYAEYGIKLTSEELVSRPKFKLSVINNRLPVKNLNKNVLPQKIAEVPSVCFENIKKEDKQDLRFSVIGKQSPKIKCAFPNKSHKNWSLWKENNLSKGKPMSLLKKELSLKRENITEVTSSCRRSDRISQATLNKSNRMACLAVTEGRSDLNDRVDVDLMGNDFKIVTKPIFDFDTECKFQIRKFGMVLYPGPSAPLNPFITYHLQKIRSYRTLIDKKWANFAVTAVVQKDETAGRKRMILPLTCCFRYENKLTPSLSEACKVETDPLKGSEDITNFIPDGMADASDKKLVNEGEEERMSRDKSSSFNCEILEKVEVDMRKKVSAKRRLSITRVSTDFPKTKKIKEGNYNFPSFIEEEIKSEDGVKEEIDIFNASSMDNGSDNMKSFSDDSNFDSDKCDIVFEKRGPKTSISKYIKENLRNSPEVIDIEDDCTELSSTVRLSPDSGQAAFNRVIAKLLTKKLNELKQSENITSSIDNLKTVKHNILELIKLNFIKENFLSGYINLWYIKSPNTRKSRVFLTFSMNPPVEGAINLKVMSKCSESDPPSIIQEIITKDKLFDPNDLAILYCDGKHWEIHGSVNFATDINECEKDESEKIQVFHLTKKVFPELEMLHDIKQKNDRNKVLKWWVMHMMQDYTEITVKHGDQVGRISRSIIIKTWKTKVPSFIEFKGLHNVRPIGVGVNPRLWPYFLIGPYYMGDHHNLTLKLNSKIVPFEYYLPLDRVRSAYLLKRFVSSVIMHSWRNFRQVVGMWLYDRIAMKQSSFIQVRTRVKKTGDYKPTVEHDYSLCQTQDGLLESEFDNNKKRVPDENNSKRTREVFLVPNVPHLGYIKGELHSDQSITIEHPLKPERKRNSQRIGDWLNRIMRKRVKFFPNDFYVRWEIVKDDELIRNLEPLDRSSLGGTHILCKKGIFYLLSLTKEKIEKLGLNESVVMDAILNNPIIQEVVEVKELGKMLLKKETCDLPIANVLQMALAEIEKLEKEEMTLRKSRLIVEKERALLCRKYLEALDNCDVDENSKRTIHFYVTSILESSKNVEKKFGNSKKEKENCRRLEAINKFLQSVRFSNSRKNTENFAYKNIVKETQETTEEKISCENPLKEENSIGEKAQVVNEKVCELESKIKTLHESLNKMNGGDVNLRKLLTKRLNAMSQHLENVKRDNMNIKLSQLFVGGIDSSTAERSYCQGSSHMTKDDESNNDRKDTKPSIVETSCQKISLEETRVLKREEANSESLSAFENIDNSIKSVTENNARTKNENALSLLKNYVEESTEIKSLNEKEEIEGNFEGKVIVEIILDEPKAVAEILNNSMNNYNCSENIASSSTSNQQEIGEMTENDEPEIDELCQVRKTVVRHEETNSKTWNISMTHPDGGNFESLEKQVRLKFLTPNSLPDGKVLEKLSGRIDYLDILGNRKQVLLVKNKRKREGANDFLKKLRTN